MSKSSKISQWHQYDLKHINWNLKKYRGEVYAGKKKKTITLNNGATMPLVGYGTYLTSPRQTEHLVRMALEVGYRHIDKAQNYGNEHEVGLAVKHSGLEREELFITSKTQTTGYQATKKGIIQSLKGEYFLQIDQYMR